MTNPPEIIHAAYNLTIELEPGRWRLFNGAHDPSAGVVRPLLEARPGAIVCSPTFARARRLPEDGYVDPATVARVVVGWAPESRNWHLGLMLQPALGDPDRLRWCGLAHWPSGRAEEYEAQATASGRALAEVIGRPFHIVGAPHPAPLTATPPTPLAPAPPVEPPARPSETEPVAPPAPAGPAAPALRAAPVVTPRTPPFAFEEWRMAATRRGFIFARPARWVIALVLRAAGYTVAALLFVMLGIGSLQSRLAQVNPSWLPYVGIGVGGVLGLLAVVTWGRALTVSDVLIDTQRREVWRRNRFSGQARWRVPFDRVEYVLLTQTPARARGRKTLDSPVAIAHDAWLHIYDGRRFWLVAELGRVEGRSYAWPLVERLQKQRGRRALDLAHYDTPAHHAAVCTAGAIAAAVWLDIR